MNPRQATVFVVDDELSVRKAIDRLLRAAGFVVATYPSAQDYLERRDPDAPGCLLLDLAMPGCSGLDLQQALAAEDDALPIIFLTGHAEVADTVQAFKHGAAEFLTKPVEDWRLIDAVRAAIDRDHGNRAARAQRADVLARLATLTPRETEVLRCVVAGKLNKQTAAELGTVEKTVKVHRARVMEKMHAHSLPELVLQAALAGLVHETDLRH